MFRSTLPLVVMMVRVVVLGVDAPGRVGGPWVLFSAGCCYSWLGAWWVALLAFVRQSCWCLW